ARLLILWPYTLPHPTFGAIKNRRGSSYLRRFLYMAVREGFTQALPVPDRFAAPAAVHNVPDVLLNPIEASAPSLTHIWRNKKTAGVAATFGGSCIWR